MNLRQRISPPGSLPVCMVAVTLRRPRATSSSCRSRCAPGEDLVSSRLAQRPACVVGHHESHLWLAVSSPRAFILPPLHLAVSSRSMPIWHHIHNPHPTSLLDPQPASLPYPFSASFTPSLLPSLPLLLSIPHRSAASYRRQDRAMHNFSEAHCATSLCRSSRFASI